MRTQVFCSVGLLRATIAPPISKARTRFGLFHVCTQRQFWRGFSDLPRERHPSHFRVFCPLRPLCSLFLSGGLASVREATSCIDAGIRAIGCGWRLVTFGDRKMKLRQVVLWSNVRQSLRSA